MLTSIKHLIYINAAHKLAHLLSHYPFQIFAIYQFFSLLFAVFLFLLFLYKYFYVCVCVCVCVCVSVCVCVLSGVFRPKFHSFSIQLVNSLGSLARKAPYGFSRLYLTQIFVLFYNFVNNY